jgi:alpha-D-ribose 1-methylphosphonate 5-triphosphate diphosphatase PhnM
VIRNLEREIGIETTLQQFSEGEIGDDRQRKEDKFKTLAEEVAQSRHSSTDILRMDHVLHHRR